MIGSYDTTELSVVVRDQFGFSVLGVKVTLSKSGDPGGVFAPPDGIKVTDTNGYASLGYTSGISYEGITVIKCSCQGGSSYSGSVYVWDSLSIESKITYPCLFSLFQISNQFSIDSLTLIRQILNSISSVISVFSKSYFSSNGGHWINPSSFASEVPSYLPMLIVSPYDGPSQSFFGWWNKEHPGGGHIIKQVLDFESDGFIQQIGPFVANIERIKQITEKACTLQISQTKSSGHSSGWPSVQESLNQFIFVSAAVPAFWSEKNPIDTDIWIRLFPYADSLNQATVKFYVREVWYDGDTGYVDMAPYLSIITIDAGGGKVGLEITCDPPIDFHYTSVVYVRIEVYDSAPVPNFIWVDYWFEVTPDYRAPYLSNLSPAREQDDVAVDTEIYFEVMDDEVGVDIDSLELYVNSRSVTPTTVVKVTDWHYKITYIPPNFFFFDKTVLVNVKVFDSSNEKNFLNDSYRFYTSESAKPYYIIEEPKQCKRGVSRYSNIRMLVLSDGNNIDQDSIKIQVMESDMTDRFKIIPIVYRIQ
jgi:hypothetical protein